MDAIELLLSDHRKVDSLFQQFEKGGNSEEFTQLFTQLKNDLTVHTQIEEEIFYPAARNNPDTADLVAEAYQEQAEVKQLLSQVEGLDNTSTEWGQRMTEIMRDVQAHVQMEETEMFPRMREHFQADQLQQLGQQLQQRKAELQGQAGTMDASMRQGSAMQGSAQASMAQPGMTNQVSNNQVSSNQVSSNQVSMDEGSSGQLGALDATTDMRESSNQM